MPVSARARRLHSVGSNTSHCLRRMVPNTFSYRAHDSLFLVLDKSAFIFAGTADSVSRLCDMAEDTPRTGTFSAPVFILGEATRRSSAFGSAHRQASPS